MTARTSFSWWIAERGRDLALWPVNIVRDSPRRVQRLAFALARRGFSNRSRFHAVLVALFDLLGGPEIAQFLMHLFMHTSPLYGPEVEAVASVLGRRAVRYGDVRIATGGILRLVFRFNGGRAFATWHTVHLPEVGQRTRTNLGLLVHEVTHVYQYEWVGTRYIGEALWAQRRMGRECYRYGGSAGLHAACDGGKKYAAFNREAQAQIAQDYFVRRSANQPLEAYEPYIAELRAGAF